MRYAITGASGQLGRIVINALKSRLPEADLVALARSPEKVQDLGVEARPFDYTKPDQLVPALEGVTTLALISSSEFEDRLGQHRNVIEAAKTAGVERILYTSILKCDDTPLLIAEDHKATEALLAESGLATTLLRNGWYTENWTGSLGAAVENGAVIGSTGDAQVTPATRQDYAEALAEAVAGKGHEGQVYELGGAPFTLSELANAATRQSGKSVVYSDMPEEAYAGILKQIGLPDGFATLVADADAKASKGWLYDDSGTLERLIGRPATPLADAVNDALA